MSLAFQFATATKIVFGSGTSQGLAAHAQPFGKAVLVVTGSEPKRQERLLDSLTAAGFELSVAQVAGEPSLELCRRVLGQAREARVEQVIAIGGGSAIDLGKAVAALLGNGGDPLDYAEVIGRGQAFTRPSLPFIAVPTTSGTGAEVTKNAVLTSTGERVKVSLRSDFMLPRLALVDPELTLSLPPAVTAATGLDAFTQVLEPYVCNQANPLTDALCREGLLRGARSLRKAFHDGTDLAAREDLALMSLCGGIALANAKLGAVHGFAAPIGGMFHAAHGAICARLLPLVMGANIRALRTRAPGSVVLERYREVAQLLTGLSTASAEAGAQFVAELVQHMGVPSLSAYGVATAHIDEIVAKAARASSMKGNPIELSPAELTGILESAL